MKDAQIKSVVEIQTPQIKKPGSTSPPMKTSPNSPIGYNDCKITYLDYLLVSMQNPFEKNPRIFFFKILITIFCILGYFSIGFGNVVVGNSSLDLMSVMQSSEVELGYVFIMKAIGAIFGGLITGYLCNLCFKYYSVNKFYNISLLKVNFVGQSLMCLIMYVTPLVKHMWVFIFLYFIFGFGSQIVINCNTIVVKFLWEPKQINEPNYDDLKTKNVSDEEMNVFKEKVKKVLKKNSLEKKLADSIMFLLHFSYAVGTFIFPSICGFVFSLKLTSESNISILFGTCMCATLIPLLVITLKSPERLRSLNCKINLKKNKKKKNRFFSCGSFWRKTFVLITSLTVFCYISIAINYSSIGFLFANKSGFDKVSASLVLSGYTGFFALGRIISIVLPLFLPPFFNILLTFLGLLGCNILFAIFASQPIAIIIFYCCSGFLVSFVIALFNLPRYYDISLDSVEIAIIYLGPSVSTFFPYVTTLIMELGTEGFVYTNLGCSVLCLLLFVVLACVGSYYKKKYGKKQKREIGEVEIKEENKKKEMNKEVEKVIEEDNIKTVIGISDNRDQNENSEGNFS